MPKLLKYLVKKKIILALLLIVVFSIFLFFKIDPTLKNFDFEKFIAIFKEKFSVFAQDYTPYFIPHYPQRMEYLVSEIAITNERLVSLNKELESTMEAKGDPDAQREKISQIRREIEEETNYLSFLKDLLDYEINTGLERELKTLRPEVANDLKSNLEQLQGKTQNLISVSQNNLSLSSSPIQYGISYQTLTLPGISSACISGTKGEEPIELKFKAGVKMSDLDLGEVKISALHLALPEKIQLSSLLELPPITIPFPDITITFPEISVDALAAINNTFDFSSSPITSKIFNLSLPKLPEISFSCPQFPSYSTPSSSSTQATSLMSTETNWYFKIFEWLSSDICQNLPGMKNLFSSTSTSIDVTSTATTTLCGIDKNGGPIEKPEGCQIPGGFPATSTFCIDDQGKPSTKSDGCYPFGECFDPKKTTASIFYRCNDFWEKYFKFYDYYYHYNHLYYNLSIYLECEQYVNKNKEKWAMDYSNYFYPNPIGLCLKEPRLPPFICQLIGAPDSYQQKIKNFDLSGKIFTVTQKLNLWCKNLSIQGCSNTDSSKNITLIEKRCDEIKKEKSKTLTRATDIPFSCRILPLYTLNIAEPAEEFFQQQGLLNYFSTGKTYDYPSTSLFGCSPPPFPDTPKIKLPDIIIPDIILPDFNFLPFFRVKLPNIIFEDLIFPEIDLCNLDYCKDIYNSFGGLLNALLNLSLPILNIPQIEIPTFSLPSFNIYINGYGNARVIPPNIKFDQFKLPPIFFKMPQLSQFFLGSLLMPELEISPISPSPPEIFFKLVGFSGFKFDLFGFFAGLAGLPSFNACAGLSLGLPLSIIFPDYYLRWPAFPEIPQNLFCRDINDFCQKLQISLNNVDIQGKIKEIEDKINNVFQGEIQSKLDQISQSLKNEIEKKINSKLEEQMEKVREELENYNILGSVRVENGIVKIPPITIPGGTIEISLSDVTELIRKEIPTEITIPWPKGLKEIPLLGNNALTYYLGKIPLSQYSYEKEFSVKLPGFHTYTLSAEIGDQTFYLPSLSLTDLFQPNQVQNVKSNVTQIENYSQETSDISKNIIDILE